MIRKTLLMNILVAIFAGELDAQAFRPHGVKIDAMGGFQRRVGLAYEWRITEKSSIEIQTSYSNHNPTSLDFFNGSMMVEYARREIFVNEIGLGEIKKSSNYFGSGRPLPELETSTVPLSTIQASLAYRVSYNEQNWRFFVQPSVNIARHQYAETSDDVFVSDVVVEQWQAGETLLDGLITRSTKHFTQVREMRLYNYWLGGVAYDIGFASTLKSGIHFDISVGLGLNVGKYPYKSPVAPFILNSVFPRYAIRVGYFFGTTPENIPIENR